MKRFLTIAALAALVVLTASCCPCRKTRSTAAAQPLVATTWQLVQLNGRAVQAEGDTFTVTFGTDGRISGMGACNRLMGPYQTGANGALTIDHPASTQMACLRGADLETAFLRMLSEATHYEVGGDELMVLTDGELRGVLRAR